MESNWESRNKPIYLLSIEFEQGWQVLSMGDRISSSTNGDETTENPHAEEWDQTPASCYSKNKTQNGNKPNAHQLMSW